MNWFYKLNFPLPGSEIHNEVHLNNGSIDIVIANCDLIHIFEFKMGQPANIAIAQIKDKWCATPYLSDGKPIKLICIHISKRKRNNVEWVEEEMSQAPFKRYKVSAPRPRYK